MKTLDEIKNLIEKSDNPLFFYDDDPDGLVSYLLLKKHFGKGEGVIIRVRGHKLNEEEMYLRKIKEYSPDLVVFLDKPTLTQDIFDKIHVKKIWIDHHSIVKVRGVVYYNPRKEVKKNQPVSYVCYQITKDNLWLAAVGVTSDWSDLLVKDFKKEYPELIPLNGKLKPDDVLFNTKLGELARIFSFVLKGKTSDVRKMVSLILKIESPEEILEQKSIEGKELYSKAEKLGKKYKKLLEEALKLNKKEKVLIFRYSTRDVSFTSELSNELIHKYPKKVVLVAREAEEELRISLRSGENGVNLPKLLEKVFKEVDGKGGGHEHAGAALIKKEDFNDFVELVKDNAKK